MNLVDRCIISPTPSEGLGNQDTFLHLEIYCILINLNYRHQHILSMF